MGMQVPQYWAEARLQEKFGRGHVSGRVSLTVRRFGWSDSSQSEAQAMAETRVRDAFDRILAGEKLPRNEPRVPYDAEGLPIREEIVARHGNEVITRNSYGSRCLNSPDVLFADVDFKPPPMPPWRRKQFVAAVVAGAVCGVLWHPVAGIAAFIAALILIGTIHGWWARRRDLQLGGGPEARALAPVKAFVAANPDWHLRVYRTPNGFRLLAMHRTFDPLDPQVNAFFEAIGADSYYALSCRHQHCFRARVSGKPWRMGLREHMPYRRSAWPIAEEHRPERERWVAEYERKAEGYAACRFVERLGSRDYVSATQSVQRLHDDLCSATRDLPMA
ncbi:hypothetical protein GLE_1385 [Lysobacter enzymogenes]|uniref:Transmembrane protein n=1 Tax=Lysobacter enzymogenes TaxID=69 RepID=A0A0S2DDQ7_LYSEN|nr:hypothetical protein [Lysobacter enzymogenes]ALN56742.1 hypothetical protein GLE_1385 [Lysobacter enzymogenes]